MLIKQEDLELKRVEKPRGGTGVARMSRYDDENNSIIYITLSPGDAFGLHTHSGTSEIMYVISGTGKVLCDGKTEYLSPGDCHYCPEGHAHTLINDGGEDLVFFAVVPQH